MYLPLKVFTSDFLNTFTNVCLLSHCRPFLLKHLLGFHGIHKSKADRASCQSYDKGPAETARMSERFVKGFGTSDDACRIHGCALLAHIDAACPWWLRIALLAGPACFAISSGTCDAACSPTRHPLQSVYGSSDVAGRTSHMN